MGETRIVKHPEMQRFTHGKRYERIYRIWKAMRSRCNYPSHPAYKRYGGIGITVCEEWNESFEAFDLWAMANGYSDDLTIDRINNAEGYTPSNCRWVSPKEQANNRKNNVFVKIGDKTQTIAQWADEYNLKYDTVRRRYKKGKTGVDLIKARWGHEEQRHI